MDSAFEEILELSTFIICNREIVFDVEWLAL